MFAGNAQFANLNKAVNSAIIGVVSGDISASNGTISQAGMLASNTCIIDSTTLGDKTNNFMNFDSTPPYTWDIQGKHAPPIGSYTLRAYVYSETGKVASDEMDIWSLSLNYYYSPW